MRSPQQSPKPQWRQGCHAVGSVSRPSSVALGEGFATRRPSLVVNRQVLERGGTVCQVPAFSPYRRVRTARAGATGSGATTPTPNRRFAQ